MFRVTKVLLRDLFHVGASQNYCVSHLSSNRSDCGLTVFSSVQSHLFSGPIGARTLKMPVPFPPPNVGVYTRTPSHQPLVFGRRGIDHLP